MAADTKMSTKFTGQASAGESKAGKQIRVAGIFVLVVFLIIGIIVGVASLRPDSTERGRAQAAEAAARAQQVALARAEVNEELLRFNEGTWVLKGHTTGNEWEVIMDSFSVDRNGDVEEFVFKYSFVINGEAHANTWSCEHSQMTRYNCTVRQQYEGGSWRNEGQLVREDDSSFSGQYLYERQWLPVSFFRKE